ncbi:MAG TPA: YhfC family glutamic-type intramembrane protease [Syntrophomonadaceae bacterium]|nr:YhfC family glutamic-type intramembrane protease [Syntrophomonadaceae bacterium]
MIVTTGNISWVFYLFTLFVCFALPVVVTVYLYWKERPPQRAVLIGAAIFLLFQTFSRIPLVNYLQSTTWFFANIGPNTWASALFMGFSAGLFEECGRFIAFQYLLNRKWTWASGVAYGIGHGGMEAMYIGIAFINFLSSSTHILSPITYLLPGVERLLAMVIQIGLSLLVLYAVKNRKYIFLLYAILLHTLVDSPTQLTQNALLIEFYVFIMAAISLTFIIKARKILDASPD